MLLKLKIFLLVLFCPSQTIFAANGLILKADNVLDYYENSQFVRQIFRFPSNNYFISYTGDHFFHAKYFLEDKKYTLHKCYILTGKCLPIKTPENTAEITEISFSDNGFGIIAKKDNTIDFYENHRYIRTIFLEGNEIKDISFVGDYFYVLQVKEGKYNWVSSEVKKCAFNNLNCSPILEINQQITAIHFRDDSEGYALTKDGFVISFLAGNYQWVKKMLDYFADKIFVTDQGFFIRQQFVEKTFDNDSPNKYTIGYFFCSLDGLNCEKIAVLNSLPVKGSFK